MKWICSRIAAAVHFQPTRWHEMAFSPFCAGWCGFPLYFAADDMAVHAVILLCIPGATGNMAMQETVHPFGPGHRGDRKRTVLPGTGLLPLLCIAPLKEGTRQRETYHRTQAGQHC